jgi:riboflavin biosynthesis pyrimidine reductase
MDKILQLYPPSTQDLPLRGLYLSHDLRQVAQTTGQPFIYANYIVSLDGRIAIPHPKKSGMTVPKAIANDRDWRLFQELAVQADVLITSGRYLRDYAEGRAQEILNIYDNPEFADLSEWRTARGLPPYPVMAVVSASLDFPIPPALAERKILIFTTQKADPAKIYELEQQVEKVIVAGETSVDGKQMVAALSELGYRTIYNSTGPKVMHLLLAAGVVNRLYLTHASRILGGDPFSSIVEGDLLEPAADFKMNTLYFDSEGLEGLGQMFVSYYKK